MRKAKYLIAIAMTCMALTSCNTENNKDIATGSVITETTAEEAETKAPLKVNKKEYDKVIQSDEEAIDLILDNSIPYTSDPDIYMRDEYSDEELSEIIKQYKDRCEILENGYTDAETGENVDCVVVMHYHLSDGTEIFPYESNSGIYRKDFIDKKGNLYSVTDYLVLTKKFEVSFFSDAERTVLPAEIYEEIFDYSYATAKRESKVTAIDNIQDKTEGN